jgi:hypothetical protein
MRSSGRGGGPELAWGHRLGQIELHSSGLAAGGAEGSFTCSVG